MSLIFEDKFSIIPNKIEYRIQNSEHRMEKAGISKSGYQAALLLIIE
jgi:hypothetical protein